LSQIPAPVDTAKASKLKFRKENRSLHKICDRPSVPMPGLYKARFTADRVNGQIGVVNLQKGQ
jgi:hypothetical protein